MSYVAASDLRRLFNAARIFERAANGELHEDVTRSSHLSRAAAHRAEQRYCTSSEIVVYSDWNGQRLAICHWYIRAGRIGGSGRPDPKWLTSDGVVYALVREGRT
jgi:outer membrane protein assembly factor BamB